MKLAWLIAGVAWTGCFLAPAWAADTPSSASASSRLAPLGAPLCLSGTPAQDESWCAEDLRTYHPRPRETNAGRSFGLSERGWALPDTLSREFDLSWDSRRQRHDRCLEQTPARRSLAYRQDSHAWAQRMAVNAREPFFYAAQHDTRDHQRSYSNYLYCMSHGGR